MRSRYLLLTALFVIGAVRIFAQMDMKETISAIKTNLEKSKESVKQYSWIETTSTYLKGELKSTKQNQCYYSVDGKLTKVATGATTQEAQKGGLRGKIIANKKEDMAEYIERAIGRINAYLPPAGDKIMQIYNSGKAGIQVLEPKKKFKLSFPDYLQAGDQLSVSMDMANQKLMDVSVVTFIDTPSDKVLFDVAYGALPDGTQYAATTTLISDEKQLKIVITNSGFKKGTGQ